MLEFSAESPSRIAHNTGCTFTFQVLTKTFTTSQFHYRVKYWRTDRGVSFYRREKFVVCDSHLAKDHWSLRANLVEYMRYPSGKKFNKFSC